jgi:hypothetical protein
VLLLALLLLLVLLALLVLPALDRTIRLAFLFPLIISTHWSLLLSDQPILFLYLRFALRAAPFRLTLSICSFSIHFLLPITVLVLPGPAHALPPAECYLPYPAGPRSASQD